MIEEDALRRAEVRMLNAISITDYFPNIRLIDRVMEICIGLFFRF